MMLWILAIIGLAIYLVFFALVFAVAIAKFCPKGSRHPNCDNLEETDNLWLAIFSPFYEPSDACFAFDEASPLWADVIKCATVNVLYIVAFLPSVAITAAIVMASLIVSLIRSIVLPGTSE